jgi:hypothetical protein
VQEPHDEPAPAITPSPPTAENSEIMRRVFSLPHLGQAMNASASAIARSASKHVPQSVHLYSYSGITSTSRPIVPPFTRTVKITGKPWMPERLD